MASEEARVKCPYCAELILREARICRYCNREVAIASASQELAKAPAPQKESKAWIWVAVAGALLLIVFAVPWKSPDRSAPAPAREAATPQPAAEPAREVAPKTVERQLPGIGQTVRAKYFDVTVHEVAYLSRINPNAIVDLVANPGEQFVVIAATIKNVDTESRALHAGMLQAELSGKTYKFESPETVLDERFTIFANLNPLTSVRTMFAFRVPKDLPSGLVWIPARSDVKISLAKPAATGYEAAKRAYDRKDYATTLAACAQALQEREPNCVNLMGVLYNSGFGVEQDSAKAFELFQMAATSGNLRAQYNLSASFLSGAGVEKNQGQAFQWALKSANQGFPLAQFLVAQMYERGVGVEADKERATHWYQAAIKQPISDIYPEKLKLEAQARLDNLTRP